MTMTASSSESQETTCAPARRLVESVLALADAVWVDDLALAAGAYEAAVTFPAAAARPPASAAEARRLRSCGSGAGGRAGWARPWRPRGAPTAAAEARGALGRASGAVAAGAARARSRRGSSRASTRTRSPWPPRRFGARGLARGLWEPRTVDDDEGAGRYDWRRGVVLFRADVGERQREHFDVGFATWPAAAVLAAVVRRRGAPPAASTAAELGGHGPRGPRLRGLRPAGAAGPTDYNEVVLDNLRFNAALNAPVLADGAAAEKLDFRARATDETFYVVLAAYCASGRRGPRATSCAPQPRGPRAACLAAPEAATARSPRARRARRGPTLVPDGHTPSAAAPAGPRHGLRLPRPPGRRRNRPRRAIAGQRRCSAAAAASPPAAVARAVAGC